MNTRHCAIRTAGRDHGYSDRVVHIEVPMPFGNDRLRQSNGTNTKMM
jgi:hypothetical protein